MATYEKHPSNEIEMYEYCICGFIGGIVRRAREIPEDKWNWSFSERTPTAREICEHSWMWLWTDRQQVMVLDPTQQTPVPDLPTDRKAMLDLLESEKDEWKKLIQSLEPAMLEELRHMPDDYCRTVRGYLIHMSQHIISKSGQMTMLYFDLGLDGGEPYDAPHPHRVFGVGDPAWPAPRS